MLSCYCIVTVVSLLLCTEKILTKELMVAFVGLTLLTTYTQRIFWNLEELKSSIHWCYITYVLIKLYNMPIRGSFKNLISNVHIPRYILCIIKNKMTFVQFIKKQLHNTRNNKKNYYWKFEVAFL